MKRYFRISVIAILVFIVIILGAYTLISFKTSLLGFFLNVYLKKHGIYQHFKNFKVTSSSSISIDRFVLKKKNVFLSAYKLQFKIDKKGRINLFLEKPKITITLEKTKGSSKNFGIPHLKIGIVNLKGLTLKVVKGNSEIVNVSQANLKLTGSSFNFSGKLYVNTNNILLIGDIDNLSCHYSVIKNGISMENIRIIPKSLNAKINGLSFQTNKPVSISSITIRFFPFSVSIGGLKGNFLSFYKNFKLSYRALLNYGNKKAYVELNDIGLIGEPMSISSIKVQASFRKRVIISALFDNLTSNLDSFVSQDLKGSITYDGAVKLKVFDGQAIAFSNLFLDFSHDTLKVLFDPKRMIVETALGDLFRSKIKRNAGSIYRISFFTNNLTGLTQFLSDSLDIQVLRDLHIQSKQLLDIDGTFYTKTKSIVALTHLFCNKMLYKKLKLFNINALFPLVVNSDKVKKGDIKIGKMAFEDYSFPLHINLKSTNNGIFAHFYPIKTQKFDLDPFNLSFKVNKKILTFSKIRARIFNRLSKTFIDLSGKYSNGILKTVGSVVIKVFDGSVKIKDISLTLKDVPIVSMNVSFDHLNLKKITQNTNFGLITGFIKGYVKNFSLVNFKYPLSFEARVETENVKGVSKRISLKAVNSISSVGGGVASIAVPFFKSFPYSTIGFTAVLKNGRFQIHGLYKSDGKEYIIKKGFLIGIDVVNMNKNNSIAWSDFVNRIKRVLRKGGNK